MSPNCYLSLRSCTDLFAQITAQCIGAHYQTRYFGFLDVCMWVAVSGSGMSDE